MLSLTHGCTLCVRVYKIWRRSSLGTHSPHTRVINHLTPTLFYSHRYVALRHTRIPSPLFLVPQGLFWRPRYTSGELWVQRRSPCLVVERFSFHATQQQQSFGSYLELSIHALRRVFCTRGQGLFRCPCWFAILVRLRRCPSDTLHYAIASVFGERHAHRDAIVVSSPSLRVLHSLLTNSERNGGHQVCAPSVRWYDRGAVSTDDSG